MSERTAPALRDHKASGQSYVRIEGRDIYLGRTGDVATIQKYARLIAEWQANGYCLPPDRDVRVLELVAPFWEHAKTYYREPDGTPAREFANYRMLLNRLKALYGNALVGELGPLTVKTLRAEMIAKGNSRKYCNKQSQRLIRIVKWGVAEGLVPSAVHESMRAVDGLKRGRTEAKESEPVQPVPDEDIEAIKPYVSAPIWALIQLQLITAARPGEVLTLRAIDLDTSGELLKLLGINLDIPGEVWTARPADHKTAHLGHERILFFGSDAQEVLRPFMASRPVDAFLFSPKEGRQEMHNRKAHCHRRPNQKKSEKKTARVIRDHYDPNTYRQAIDRACIKAGVARWTPYRLRHNAATRIRREHGLEAAQIILGHQKADVTQVYAERDMAKAVEAVRMSG